ncbi:MAG: hypothetical protein PHW64_00645 [Sulfuricurvum sp.]|nr:hypothetical protein [Sulfuricurvum sp.]
MHGKRVAMWLSKLKAAIILEEVDTLSSLLDEIPKFESLEQMEEAAFLLAQSITLIEHHKIKTAQTLQQLKNTIDFLKSTQSEPSSSINLKF